MHSLLRVVLCLKKAFFLKYLAHFNPRALITNRQQFSPDQKSHKAIPLSQLRLWWRAIIAAAAVSLGCNTSASASVNFVQYNVGLGQTPQSMAITYTNAQTAGDLNVVFIGWLGATVHVQSVTDSAGNTYAVAAAPTISGPSGVAQIFNAKNIAAVAANTNSVKVTFDGLAGWPDVRIAECSGIDTVNPLDVSSGNAGVGLTAGSGSVTTTHADDHGWLLDSNA